MKSEFGSRSSLRILQAALILTCAACGPSEIRPVELFPEDMCAHCRMAVSDHRCASEIIASSGEVFKFDDMDCLDAFRSERADVEIAAIFVKDFETKTWLPADRAVVVTTSVFTPMGSGRVAFGDSARAREFLHRHPVAPD